MEMLAAVACFLARVAGAWATSRTFFQPDEYWQTLEIAHRIVFGYGYQTWEWTGASPIRSVVHPALFVPLYAVLKHTGADQSAFWMAIAPALQQALIATVGDLCFYRLADRLSGKHHARVWVRASLTQALLHAFSLYWTYTSTRPFSNSTEAALVSIALGYWPLTPQAASHTPFLTFHKALFAAFVAVLLRPTSLLLWAFLGAKTVLDALRLAGIRRALLLVLHAVATGTLVLGAGYVLDSWYFQHPTFTVGNFFHENVVRSLSVFYGVHPWHWYVSQGLPAVLTVVLPWSLKGWLVAWRMPTSSPSWTLAGLCAWTLGAYSLLSHKEARFLQPLIPILHLFAAQCFAPFASTWRGAWHAMPKLLRGLLLAQVPFTMYITAFHAQGQIAVMQYIHQAATERTTFGFLMPCHSTPWQSHMHARVLETTDLDSGLVSGDVGRAWFLACPPPRHTDPSTYWDQSDFFFYDPVRYLRDRFPAQVDPRFPAMRAGHFRAPRMVNTSDAVVRHARHDLGWRHTWPSHLVVYDSLLATGEPESVGVLLARRGYREEQRFWNALWHPEPHRRGDIVVLRYTHEHLQVP